MVTVRKFPTFAATESREAESLFGGRLSLGNVSLLTAPAKTGKGNCWASFLRYVTTGEPFPGETAWRAPRSAVLVSHEDDDETAIVPRLACNRVDRSRVLNLKLDENGNPFELPRDHGLLWEAVESCNAQLVILDPLQLVSTAPNSGKGANSVIWPLASLAKDLHCCVLLVHHTRADGVTTQGSQQVINRVRCELRLNRDSLVPSDRILSVFRTNLPQEPSDIRFTFGEDGSVRWLDREAIQDRSRSRRGPVQAATVPAVSRMRGPVGHWAPPQTSVPRTVPSVFARWAR